MSELAQTGGLSILNFYERRARRLFPALLVVMLCSLPFAWHYLLPEQLIDFSKSLVFSLLFSSNFYWDLSLQEYGAESALLKPFLHTWSLAVEEQYYIVFPVLLLVLYKWCKNYLTIVLVIAFLLSVLFAQWKTGHDVSFSFYMMPTRFWELLSGSLLALVVLNRSTTIDDSWWHKFMPSLGLLLIMGSLTMVGLEAHHPGFITLIPVLGAVLIIFFKNEHDWVSRILSRPTMVYLGLLSYSLYLWHYPIFAFGRMIAPEPSLTSKGVWIILTLLFSAMTYHLVEKPFRSKKVSRKVLIAAVLSASSFVIIVSLYWIGGDGIPGRGGYLQNLIHSFDRRHVTKDGLECQSGDRRGRFFPLSGSCIFNYAPESSTLVLVGDSHAGALAESVRSLAWENQLNYVQVTAAGCPHLADLKYGGHINGGVVGKLCRGRSKELRSFLSSLSDPIVIYSSRLPLYLELEEFDNQEINSEVGHKALGKDQSPQEKLQRFQAVASTLNGWVADGYRMVIVYPVPEQGFSVGLVLHWHSPPITSVDQLPTLSTSYDVFKERVTGSYRALDLVTGQSVIRVYPEELFCRQDTGRCIASESDRLYFQVDNHVSPLGADLIIREVASQLELSVPDSFRK